MTKYISMENIKFVLHEVLGVENLCQYERYADYDKDSFNILLESMKDYSDKVLYPVYEEMDLQPARYEDGKIIVHPTVGQLMDDAGDIGMIGHTFDYENGGMQIPHTIATAMGHIAECANNHLTGYTGLTHGAADLIVTFGTQELKDLFVPNMISGKWAGTMCLTEPQAGSSLADIVTSANPNDDGSYNIVGQKIFISGGDHEYCENFVHLVLARIVGAPEGTKGISLFAVPKNRPADSGVLESNSVSTVGDFQKMGQKGYCTTHLVFGEDGSSKGWLIGTPNNGLKHMFQMMNAARIDVGFTAASTATAAYYASLQYAKERPQGRRVSSTHESKSDNGQTLIINHPDVRRMLLSQKAITEGAIALLAQASYYHDMSIVGEEDDRDKYHNMLELLTPIAKTYPTEKGREAINYGVQILGGYGYCSEFLLQQYLRDIRIMSIYEGTTGIQSLDLLGRKVVMKNGEAMKQWTEEVISTIKSASQYNDLIPYANQLKDASKKLESTLMHLLQFAMTGNHERYIADANIFMELMSTIAIAWQWLKMATTAKSAMVTETMIFDRAFYESKIYTMRFFFKHELTNISSCIEKLKHKEVLTILDDHGNSIFG